MTTRKKWRLRWAPSGSTERVPSSTRAYEAVNDQRKRIEDGHSDITSVTVEVDTGDGHGWQPYEHVTFSRPGGAS